MNATSTLLVGRTLYIAAITRLDQIATTVGHRAPACALTRPCARPARTPRAVGRYDATEATRNVAPGISRCNLQVIAMGRSPWWET